MSVWTSRMDEINSETIATTPEKILKAYYNSVTDLYQRQIMSCWDLRVVNIFCDWVTSTSFEKLCCALMVKYNVYNYK